MRKVKFTANLTKLTATAPEEGGVSMLTNSFSLNKPDRKAFAALCEKPDEALRALDATLDANGKAEIPCGKEVCALTVQMGSKAHEVTEAHFKKVVLDSRGGECQMRVVVQEPKTADAMLFYGRGLGCDLDLAAVPQQMTIDEAVEKKAE